MYTFESHSRLLVFSLQVDIADVCVITGWGRTENPPLENCNMIFSVQRESQTSSSLDPFKPMYFCDETLQVANGVIPMRK